jgi:hypothetical protein
MNLSSLVVFQVHGRDSTMDLALLASHVSFGGDHLQVLLLH